MSPAFVIDSIHMDGALGRWPSFGYFEWGPGDNRATVPQWSNSRTSPDRLSGPLRALPAQCRSP